MVLTGVLFGSLGVSASTNAAFTATTSNAGSDVGTGAVVISDDDGSSALFSMSNLKAGDSEIKCVTVTYTGTLGSSVRLYATGAGTLGPYLTLKVTRGSFVTPPGGGDCTGFTADSADYKALGAGVLYNAALSSFGGTWAAGTVDPSTTTSPTAEVWTANEKHAYKLQLTVADDSNGQLKTAAPSFTWEARDASTSGGGTGSYYANAVLADNPSSFWRLDETSGTTATDTKAAVNGTYSGGVTLGTAGPLRDGAPAPTLDGAWITGGHISAGDTYGFAGTSQFSVDMWVRRTDAANYTTEFLADKQSWGGSGWNGWSLSVPYGGGGTSDRVAFERGNNGVSDWVQSPAAALPLNTWVHVAGTFDGTSLNLYVNGALVGSSPAGVSIPTVPAGFEMGSWAGYYSMQGSVADVAVYPYALSAAQVAAHYNARN